MASKRKNKARRYRRRGVERAAVELAVAAFAKDIGDVIELHNTIATARLLAAKNQRRQRSEEELEVLSLARVLESLAKQYPRFADHLRKLQHYLRKRLTRPAARRAEILAHIDDGPVDLNEIVQCTLYDPPVVRSDIRWLVRAGRVREVNRDGNPVRRAPAGRAIEKVFYRAAGPSQVAAQRR